jgi:hypothetical protein
MQAGSVDSDDRAASRLPRDGRLPPRPVVQLHVTVLVEGAPQCAPRANVTADGLVVVGEVSAGRRGWQLSGAMVRHRRRLMLQLVARRQDDAPAAPDIERLHYRAVVSGVPAGSFDVYQRVMFVMPGLPLQLPEAQFVGTVAIT